MPSDLQQKLTRFQNALSTFLERLEGDRNILAAVLVGSLSDITVWHKEAIGLWLIERDGVTRRFLSDGKDERLFRTFVEDDINIHAELIPRSRFKLMIEGSSRTAFSCNFFAARELVYCEDASIEKWFHQANDLATKDQEKELLAAMTWAIHACRHTEKELEIKGDLDLVKQEMSWVAHSLAAIEIIQQGEVHEDQIIYRAMELNPELFQKVYVDILKKKKSKKLFREALKVANGYLEDHVEDFLKPLLQYLRKEQRVVPLSELADHFAHTQIYPGHLESACEWLCKKGRLEKFATPFRITGKSRIEVEEPAYSCDE